MSKPPQGSPAAPSSTGAAPAARRRLLVALGALVLGLATRCWPAADGLRPAVVSPATLPATSPAVPVGSAVVQVPGTTSTTDGDVAREALAVVHELHGRVVDEAGVPMPGVSVHLALDPSWSPMERLRRAQRGEFLGALASAVSSADGAFRLVVPQAEIASPLQVHALGAAHADAVLRSVRIRAARTVLPDCVLRNRPAVRVLVVDDADESPIAGALVSVRTDGLSLLRLPGREHGRYGVTDEAGQVTIAGLPAGSYTFRAEAKGHAAGELPQQAVQADEAAEVLLALSAGRSLSGHVVDRGGRAIEGAFVEAAPLAAHRLARVAATTNADGHFVLEGLPADPLRLQIGKRGFQTLLHEPLAVGADRLVFTLQPTGSIRLEVVDARGEVPTPFTVVLRPAGPGAAVRERPPQSVGSEDLEAGAVRIDDLEPGTWTLRVTGDRFAAGSCEGLAVAAGATTPARVVVAPGATLRFVVRHADGRAAAGARVVMQPDGFLDGALGPLLAPLQAASDALPTSMASGEGAVALRHVAPGSHQLRLEVADRAPFYVRGGGVAAAAVDLGVVTLPAVVQLGGTVLVGDAVDRRVVVQVQALAGGNLPPGHIVEATVDADGAWRCATRLPPGRYLVMAGRRLPENPFLENQDRAQSRTEIVLEDAIGERRVDLRLPRGP